MGLGSLATAVAAFAVVVICCTWLLHDAGPLIAASRPETRSLAASANSGIAETRINDRARRPRFGAGGLVPLTSPETELKPGSATASFGERFAVQRSSQATEALTSFDDRFSANVLASVGPVRFAAGARPKATQRFVAATAAPRATTRTAVLQPPPKRAPKAAVQLASASESSLPLGYAAGEPTTASDPTVSLKALLRTDLAPLHTRDTGHTAIYDITSHTVYLPNGRRLEAHSGLGSHMDDPQSVARRNTGVTPPNVYELKMRESPFHGVRAIRLIPKDGSKMYGRSGMLAHSYMLGPNGQSNGCVSFSDYSAFLNAYEQGDVTHLVVVEHLGDAPSPKTASQWLSTRLKEIFSRS